MFHSKRFSLLAVVGFIFILGLAFHASAQDAPETDSVATLEESSAGWNAFLRNYHQLVELGIQPGGLDQAQLEQLYRLLDAARLASLPVLAARTELTRELMAGSTPSFGAGIHAGLGAGFIGTGGAGVYAGVHSHGLRLRPRVGLYGRGAAFNDNFASGVLVVAEVGVDKFRQTQGRSQPAPVSATTESEVTVAVGLGATFITASGKLRGGRGDVESSTVGLTAGVGGGVTHQVNFGTVELPIPLTWFNSSYWLHRRTLKLEAQLVNALQFYDVTGANEILLKLSDTYERLVAALSGEYETFTGHWSLAAWQKSDIETLAEKLGKSHPFYSMDVLLHPNTLTEFRARRPGLLKMFGRACAEIFESQVRRSKAD